MNRPKNQFLSAPARSNLHLLNTAALSQNSTIAAGLSRAIFSWQTSFDAASVETTHKFQDKVQENYDKKLQSLTARIKTMEKQNIDPEVIKENLKKEKIKMLQEAFDQTLQDLKINKEGNKAITYLEVVNDPDYGSRMEAIYKTYADKVDADVSKAVDSYFTQKGIASGKIKAALSAIPAATAPLDFTSPNPEIQRLQELRAAREQTLDTSKKNRSELLQNEAMRYRATTGEIDKLTSPKGGRIDDYDDGYNPFSKVTDEDNPTRYRLNGYLYAQYIFSGGGDPGMQAVNAGLETPYKLYHSTLGDSRFTMKDLNSSEMGLSKYFDLVKTYTTFDKPLGVMAGIWKLIDDNIKDPTEHQRYLEYVQGKFTELKTGPAANDAEKQLEILFSIKPRSEFLHLDPNWKNAYNKIDQLTDSSRDGAKVSDYPGTDKDSPTRKQLNGYLYSVYLFNGKSEPAMQSQYERAGKIYDNSRSFSHPTKMFTQELLENVPKDNDPDNDSLGLGAYLREAEGYTKYDNVKGVIAGLLKQSDAINNVDEKVQYQKYLRDKFDALKNTDGEDNQLMQLATVRSPAESIQEVRESMRIGLIDLMIQASQQHNQFKFSPALNADFAPDKPTLDSSAYESKAAQARSEIESFIKTRADADMKDLRNKYQILTENNSKLAKPLYGPTDLDPLRLAVDDSDKQFNAARAVNRTTQFRQAIEDKYLEKLTTAEKNYIDRVTELDAKLQAVKDGGSTTIPTNVAPPTGADAVEVPSAGNDSTDSDNSPENKPAEADPYTTNWYRGERVTPLLGNFSGVLNANSTDPNEKVIGYNYKGERVATLNNNTEVTRTPKDAEQPARKVENLNFVRVTYKGQKMWIPEEQLFQQEEKDAAESTNVQPAQAVINLEGATSQSENSDKYTAAWEAASRIESKLLSDAASYVATSSTGEKINLRNAQGEIILQVDPNTLLRRTAEDAAEKARNVQDVPFVRLTYQDKQVWVAESLLKKVDTVPTDVGNS